MRRVLTWLAGAVGLAALARLLARRDRMPAPVAVGDADPADELRQKLADRREGPPAPDRAPAASATAEAEAITGAEAAADEDATAELQERRASVHARAQEAIELMRDDETTAENGNGDPLA